MRFLLILLSLVFSSFSAPLYQSNGSEELVAVGISGAKIQAGTYRVSPDQRVLDVIKMANNGKLPPLDTIDCRHIIITKSNDNADTIDLLRYLSTGDLSQNPYVASGQTILIKFATEWVFVSGDLQGVLPGNVPLKNNETVGDFLSLYTPNATADLNKILVERIGESGKEFSLGELKNRELQNLDAITIFPLKDRQDIYRVNIIGEVNRPGIYSVEHGKTTARALLVKAGGSTDIGDEEGAWLIRKGKMSLLPDSQLVKGMESVNKEITYSAMNGVASRDFLLFPLKNGEITVEDGDEIVIPRKERLVYVSGLVKKPGGYDFVKGNDLAYYINQAGGFTRQADRRSTKVIETYGEVYRTVENKIVSSGDLILVPEKDKERRTRFVLGVVTSIATTLTSAVALTTFIQNQID